MATVQRTALVPFRPEQMFDLVNDVERYPEFLHWCQDARVQSAAGEVIVASLTLQLAGVEQTFTTRNSLDKPHAIAMELVAGPFRSLSGDWRFQALGEQGCKIALHLQFEFANRVLDAAFRRSFSRLAERLVHDFSQRANACYA